MKKFILTLIAAALMPVLAMAQCPTPTTATATVTLKRVIPGLLDGKFSVSETKKVAFSQGNLQYQASTDKWRFAEHQWDAIGGTGSGSVAPLNVTSGNNTAEADRDTQSDWIDLFGWATSGNSASGTRYQPWQCSDSDNNYGNTCKSDGTNPGSGENWDASKADWAQNMPGTWRTLTKDEWCYLIGGDSPCRPNATDLRQWKIVNGVPGLVIMPDGWTGTWSDSWETLEAANAVFLPAAGYRDRTFAQQAGTIGRYWSSTANGATYAYDLFFGSGTISPKGYNVRYLGRSVRLVQDVK